MNSDNVENLYEVVDEDIINTSSQIEREEIREIIGDFSFSRDYYENWGGDY